LEICNFIVAGGLFIFMNDMGKPIIEDEAFLNEIFSFEDFSPLFSDLVNKTMVLVDNVLRIVPIARSCEARN